MYRILITTIILFSTRSVLADSLVVQQNFLKYKVEYSDSLLHLTGEAIDIKINAKKCNEEMIKQTSLQIKNQLKYNFLPVLPKNGLRITQGMTENFEDKDSLRGRFFVNLPNLFKQLVIEEQLNCKK
ncbi:MAG: hypothetical protein L6Q33_01825 [Bacteriovoracaceae bacterium]|jgi:hypothetical protein|nr:hypothetical protein [Bacteriovoracaceae bacterium]